MKVKRGWELICVPHPSPSTEPTALHWAGTEISVLLWGELCAESHPRHEGVLHAQGRGRKNIGASARCFCGSGHALPCCRGCITWSTALLLPCIPQQRAGKHPTACSQPMPAVLCAMRMGGSLCQPGVCTSAVLLIHMEPRRRSDRMSYS